MRLKSYVLIIEHRKKELQNLEYTLSENGLYTITASNGVDGIQKAFYYKPDIILCDLDLPDISGYEIYNALEKLKLKYHVPFICLSTNYDPDKHKNVINMGVDDILLIPEDYKVIADRTRAHLNKRRKYLHYIIDNFSVFINNVFLGIFIVVEKKVVFTNMKFRTLLGYKRHELEGYNYLSLISKDEKNIIQRQVEQMRTFHDHYVFMHINLKHKSGDYIFCEIYAGETVYYGQQAFICTIQPKTNNGEALSQEDLYPLEINADHDYLNQKIVSVIEQKDHIPGTLLNNLINHLINTRNRNHNDKLNILSKREKEILDHICNGMSTQEIAEKLFISKRTVDNHRVRILKKMNARNTAQLVKYAIKAGYHNL